MIKDGLGCLYGNTDMRKNVLIQKNINVKDALKVEQKEK